MALEFHYHLQHHSFSGVYCFRWACCSIELYLMLLFRHLTAGICLQCFDAVSWVTEKASDPARCNLRFKSPWNVIMTINVSGYTPWATLPAYLIKKCMKSYGMSREDAQNKQTYCLSSSIRMYTYMHMRIITYSFQYFLQLDSHRVVLD